MSRRPELFLRFVDALSAATKLMRLYGADHYRLAEARESCHAATKALIRDPLAAGGVIRLANRIDRLFLENVPISSTSTGAPFLIDLLRRNQATAVSIDLKSLRTQPEEVFSALDSKLESDCVRWLSDQDLTRLEQEGSGLGSQTRGSVSAEHLLFRLPDFEVRRDDYLTAVDGLEDFMVACNDTGGVDLDSTIPLANQMVSQLVEHSSGVLPMATVPYYDRFTYYHSINVCLLTLTAAQLLTDDPDQLLRFGRAALLHDVGKARIPEEILYKPGKLTDVEFDLVKRHPVLGSQMLQSLDPVDPLIVSVAFGHHIQDGGGGYPKVSSKYKRGPVTSLVQVADIFEALTARRPYKEPLTAQRAFELLYSMHGIRSLRPYIDILYRAIGTTPVGSRVRTEDGEVGVVREHAEGDSSRPVVQIVEPCPWGDASGATRLEAQSVDTLEPDEDVEFCEG